MNFLCASLMLALAAMEAGDVEATRLDGPSVRGRIAAWDAERVQLTGPQVETTIAADNLLSLTWSPAKAASQSDEKFLPTITLLDGTSIRCSSIETVGPRVTVVGSYFSQPLKVSLDAVESLELQPRGAPESESWRAFDAADAAGDLLIVAKKEGATDYLVGKLGDLTPDQATFTWEGETINVKREKIAGVRFFHPPIESAPSKSFCIISTRRGERIAASQIALRDGVLNITTPAELIVAIPLADIAAADFSAGKIAYLSALKPLDSTWTPLVALPESALAARRFGEPKSDRSFGGGPLQLAWDDSGRDLRKFARGLAIRSRTERTYRIPAGMRRLIALAGIDPITREQGAVTLEFRGDERVLWQGEVDGRQPPVEIDVELGDARKLRLRVDYGRNGDDGDRLHLAEARFVK